MLPPQQWEYISGLIGPQRGQQLQQIGLAALRSIQRRRSHVRHLAHESEVAAILVCVATVALIVWYTYGRPSMGPAPHHGGHRYKPPQQAAGEELPNGGEITQLQEAAAAAHISHIRVLPLIALPEPSQLQSKIIIPSFTSGNYQIGPLDTGPQLRLVTDDDPSKDEVTDFVTAQNVIGGVARRSLWRFQQDAGGHYFIRSMLNNWYMSADLGSRQQLRVQRDPKLDEQMVIEGTGTDAFRIFSRKKKWDVNGMYLHVQETGRVVMLPRSAGSGTLLRAFHVPHST
jgi:hypothetical protein